MIHLYFIQRAYRASFSTTPSFSQYVHEEQNKIFHRDTDIYSFVLSTVLKSNTGNKNYKNRTINVIIVAWGPDVVQKRSIIIKPLRFKIQQVMTNDTFINRTNWFLQWAVTKGDKNTDAALTIQNLTHSSFGLGTTRVCKQPGSWCVSSSFSSHVPMWLTDETIYFYFFKL